MSFFLFLSYGQLTDVRVLFTDAASSGKAGGKHGKSVAGLKVKGMSGKKGKK